MNFHKLKSVFLIAAGLVAAAACKKDEDETNVVYLKGSLKFSVPEFILPGEVLKMTPSGLTHPDNGEIGYCWKVTPSMTKYDTTRFENGLDKEGKASDGSISYKFSDTLRTYTVYCYGFAEGYTSSSSSNSTTVVQPGPEGSIKGAGIDAEKDPYITVNGNKFYYTTIGKLDWFKQNLAYTKGGTPYRNAGPMDGVFGRYYSYNDAKDACPEGWRLPTDEDWASLAEKTEGSEETYVHKEIPGIVSKLISNAYFQDIKMWEYWPAVGRPNNETGLGIIPAGYSNLGLKNAEGVYASAKFTGVYEYATFWTADMVEDEEGMAYYRYLIATQPDLMIGKADAKSFGAAVRCIRKK